MADSIRGDGLFRAHRALVALVEDPQRLDRARGRFSESPPSYTSPQSQNSTLTQSPDEPSEEQRRHEERKWQLKEEYYASFPFNQYEAQMSEEIDRLYEANQNWTCRQPVGTNFYKLAEESVKKRWVEQGIWDEKWGRAADVQPPLFHRPSKTAEVKLGQPNSDVEMRRTAERRHVPERERQTSRPFYQFLYQVSEARERIQTRQRAAEGDLSDSPDINTKAYEEVKNTWTKRSIWNRKWGVLPGMSWKHEQDLEEMLQEEMSGDHTPAPTNVLEGDESRIGNAPPRRIFELPESNHDQTSDNIRTPPQELLAAVDHTRSPNSNTSHPLFATNSRCRVKECKQNPYSSPQQQRRLVGREPTLENGQVPHIALSQVQSFNKSNAQPQNELNSRRRMTASMLLSETGQQPQSDMANAESRHEAVPIQPRRSRCLQDARSKTTAGSAVNPANSPKNPPISRSTRASLRTLKSAGSMKPTGVSKNQHSGTKRRRRAR